MYVLGGLDMDRALRRSALAVVFFLSILAVSTAWSFELNAGVTYSFAGQLRYALELNSLTVPAAGPATTSGFSLQLITDLANEYFLALGGIAKYDIKLELGTVSLYGMGGMLVPVLDFAFEKITSVVRIGAKYYLGSVTFNTGIFSLFLPTGTKVEGLEVSLGYAF